MGGRTGFHFQTVLELFSSGGHPRPRPSPLPLPLTQGSGESESPGEARKASRPRNGEVPSRGNALREQLDAFPSLPDQAVNSGSRGCSFHILSPWQTPSHTSRPNRKVLHLGSAPRKPHQSNLTNRSLSELSSTQTALENKESLFIEKFQHPKCCIRSPTAPKPYFLLSASLSITERRFHYQLLSMQQHREA